MSHRNKNCKIISENLCGRNFWSPKEHYNTWDNFTPLEAKIPYLSKSSIKTTMPHFCYFKGELPWQFWRDTWSPNSNTSCFLHVHFIYSYCQFSFCWLIEWFPSFCYEWQGGGKWTVRILSIHIREAVTLKRMHPLTIIIIIIIPNKQLCSLPHLWLSPYCACTARWRACKTISAGCI